MYMKLCDSKKIVSNYFLDALKFLTGMLTAFYCVAFVKTWINYRETSSNYCFLGDDLMPNLGIGSYICIGLLAAVVFALIKMAERLPLSSLMSNIYKYRFFIGCAVVAICTVFELSGSSIACLSSFLNEDGGRGVLFGIPRAIRSDEWKVFTPFAFSQGYTGFSASSELLRGTSTDVTMVYAQPCWAVPTFFRPFLWGYLLLGSTRGLAFYWSARLVCLFLVTESFAKRLFSCDRKVSVAFALMVAFSGVVQWWFAVNGVAELFIFGQLLVICFDDLLFGERTERRFRILLAALIAWLAVAYIMILYPAWQVPLFWVYLAIAFSRVLVYLQRGYGLSSLAYRLRPLIVSLALLVLAAAVCFLPVLDVVSAVQGTVYPGSRFNKGGGLSLVELGNWTRSIFSSLAASSSSSLVYPDGFQTNVCESAVFFSAAPIGCLISIICCGVSVGNRRKPDSLLLSLAVLELALIIYCVCGLPRVFASLTLLAHSTERRVWQMVGYLDLILVFRVASLGRCESKDGSDLRIALLIVASLLVSLAFSLSAQNVRLLFVYGSALGMFCLLASLVGIHYGIRGSQTCLLLIGVFVCISGATVNPLQKGAPPLTEGPTATAIKNANEEGDIWFADSSLLGDLCVAEGASCINSVNTYPALSIWKTIDTEGKYENVYNRYAHIEVVPVSGASSFDSAVGDQFTVRINLDDARKLGVTKWITKLDLSSYKTDSSEAILVASTGDYKVWKLVESS